ncbi:LPO_1073/Vpar_1526 family protein [Variovorax paradoxus]|uniref:LPO_1073/Vpar_1526 family protein n=1 Tax=Variovorax paradoxus TaxID=34073 RepID=UPI003AADA04B
MMLGGQAQAVSDGSTAIQSSGPLTIHNHGFSAAQVGEVSTLVDLFLKAQLPAFEARAQKIAEENSAKLLEAFIAHAAKSAIPLSGDEFSKPAGQAAFHSALAGVALHADNADIDMVAAALVRRLDSANEPLLKLVLDSVIAVLPKLSAGHISFLGLVHYLKKANDFERRKTREPRSVRWVGHGPF